MPDESSYPMHLFGCASNSRKYFKMMNAFLENVEVANKKWVKQEMRVKTRAWQYPNKVHFALARLTQSKNRKTQAGFGKSIITFSSKGNARHYPTKKY